MRSSRRALFLFALANLLLVCRAAFFAAFGSGVTGVRQKSRESRVKVSALKELNVREKSVSGLTKLRFQASTNYATKPPAQRSSSSITTSTHQNDRDDSLREFLFREDHRDMILAGRNNRVEWLSNPDKSLYRIWRDETMETSGRFSVPSLDDPILRVTSTGISFPGLSLLLVATVGCKQVVRKAQHNDSDERIVVMPELQITLLSNQLQAKGPEPLVWVFNQLTGADKTKTSSNRTAGRQRRPQLHLFPFNSNTKSGFATHSTNTVTAEPLGSDSGDVIFRSVADLTIDVTFPSFLLKILPVSKTTAEKQGSDAILKVIERDIGPCLDNLQRKYVRLVEDGRSCAKNDAKGHLTD